jgi:hypothetical protein
LPFYDPLDRARTFLGGKEGGLDTLRKRKKYTKKVTNEQSGVSFLLTNEFSQNTLP